MNTMEMESEKKQALIEHLRELRSCLIVSLAAVCLCFLVCYSCIQPLGRWFFAPLADALPQGTSLIFSSYQEGFFFI